MKRRVISLLGLLVFAAGLSAQIRPDQRQIKELLFYGGDLESMRRYEQAAEVYVRLCEANPGDLTAYSGARRCLLQLRQFARLEQLIRTMQKSYRHLQFEVDLAEIIYQQGERQQAIRQWQQVADSNPLSEEAYAVIGNALETHELWEEALALYQQGEKRLKSPTRFAMEKSRVYYQQSKYALSTETVCDHLADFPEQSRVIHTQLLHNTEEPAAYRETVRVLEKQIKSRPHIAGVLRQILGAVQMQAKNYDAALKQYWLVETEDQEKNENVLSGQFLYMLGMTAMQDSAWSSARQAFSLLIEKIPASSFGRRAELSLAEILEKQKEYSAAIAAYAKVASRRDKNRETRTALVRIAEIQFNDLFDLTEAEKTFKRVLAEYNDTPDRLACQLRLGEVALAADDLDVAAEYFSGTARSSPKNSQTWREASLALARMDFYAGRPGRAINKLQPMFQVKSRTAGDKTENDALELYLLLSENSDDSTGLARLGEARLRLLQRRYDAVIGLLSSQPALSNNESVFTLVEAYRRSGRAAQAVPVCEQLVLEEDSAVADRVLFTLAAIYEQDLGDLNQARKNYETLLEKFPASIYIEPARHRVRVLDRQLHQERL